MRTSRDKYQHLPCEKSGLVFNVSTPSEADEGPKLTRNIHLFRSNEEQAIANLLKLSICEVIRKKAPMNSKLPIAARGLPLKHAGCSTPKDDTLIIDIGQDIVGIYSVADKTYVSHRGAAISEAISRVQGAAEVVTYSGVQRPALLVLGQLAGLPEGEMLSLNGARIDMREICWGNKKPESSLIDTYKLHFCDVPALPDTYEDSNYSDVWMIFQLWELWIKGELKVLDGHDTTYGGKPTDGCQAEDGKCGAAVGSE
jgi:hypothetical protein